MTKTYQIEEAILGLVFEMLSMRNVISCTDMTDNHAGDARTPRRIGAHMHWQLMDQDPDHSQT